MVNREGEHRQEEGLEGGAGCREEAWFQGWDR